MIIYTDSKNPILAIYQKI